MDPLVAGFWGAFFGTAALMLAGAFAAYLRSLRRVAVMAASASLLFALFVGTCLGLLPPEEGPGRDRLIANVTALGAVMLGNLVLAMIGLMRDPAIARRLRTGLAAIAIAVITIGWLLPPIQAYALSVVVGFIIGVIALVLCIRRAQRGDRLAGLAISGVMSVLIAAAGLTWITTHGFTPWPVHAMTAVASMGYLSVIAVVLWRRFSYLFELAEMISHGPAYDPITRMRTHSETGQMVGLAFFNEGDEAGLVGVIAVSIGNLLTLEKFHGRAAVNHGLFVSAGRLRRSLHAGVEAGRLGEDGFLVLVRDVDDVGELVELGHLLVQRLSRPVALSTSAQPQDLETGQAHWVAQVGVGIVVASAADRPSEAITQALAMSRAAWAFPGRVAWQDDSGEVTEAPQFAAA